MEFYQNLFSFFFLSTITNTAIMSDQKAEAIDFFSDPQWPQNLLFNSPKTFFNQMPTYNELDPQTHLLSSSTLKIMDTFENTHDQQSEFQDRNKNKKSAKLIKIRKKRTKLDDKKNQAKRERKCFQKNKCFKKKNGCVQAMNNQVIDHPNKQQTEELQIGKQELKLDKNVNVETCTQFKDRLEINLTQKLREKKLRPGKKLFDEVMEQKVIQYIRFMQASNRKFSTRDVRDKALEFKTYQHFKASKGWYERFRVRNADIFNAKPKRQTSKK